MKTFEVSNYIVTVIKEIFWQIEYQIQLKTPLIRKNVSDEVFTEAVIFYGVTSIQKP